MATGYESYNTKSKSHSSPVAVEFAVRLVEFLKDTAYLVFRDARAVICHLKYHESRDCVGFQHDLLIRSCVFVSIFQEIPDCGEH